MIRNLERSNFISDLPPNYAERGWGGIALKNYRFPWDGPLRSAWIFNWENSLSPMSVCWESIINNLKTPWTFRFAFKSGKGIGV